MTPHLAPRGALALYCDELRAELLLRLRAPSQLTDVLGIILPFVGLGLVIGVSPAMLGFFGALGAINIAFTFVAQATVRERSEGWQRLRRLLPAPPYAHFAAKLTIGLIYAVIFAALLTAGGLWLAEGAFELGSWLYAVALFTLGTLPMCALGLALAHAGPPSSAQSALVNATLLLVGLAVLGLFDLLPGALGELARWLNALSPAYHLLALAFGDAGGVRTFTPALHVTALALYTLLALLLAAWLYRREEGMP